LKFHGVESWRGLWHTRFEANRPRDPVQLAKQVHVWSLEEIVMMADSYMPAPGEARPLQKTRVTGVKNL
jgi:hypothetical protein